MQLDTRVEQLRTLISQRDDIDRQIAGLIGEAPQPAKGIDMSVHRELQRSSPKATTRKSTRGSSQIDTILKLRDKGLSIREIAAKLDMSYGAVYQRLKKMGNGGSAETQQRQPAADESPDERVPGAGRIKDMLRNGLDDEFIANEAGVKIRTVAFIRRQMAGRGELQ